MNPLFARKLRPRPAILRALGHREPPGTIEAGGARFELDEVFKHDSWAATALYRGEAGRVVAKFNREQPLFLIPMGWLGRWLGRREARAIRLLRGTPGVAPDAGEVRVDGRLCPSAVAHTYIEGHPLHTDERPGDAFFPRLQETVREMHARGIAYLDLNKRENILVAEDGLPVLTDFQIHYAPSPRALRFSPVRALLRECQAGDLYHLHKHIMRHRPDLVSPEQKDIWKTQPLGGRIWRILYVYPARFLRRRLLVWLRVRQGEGKAPSELFPEKAAGLTLDQSKEAQP